MRQLFECLRCGAETIVTDLPARCGRCGYGSGIIQPAPAEPQPANPDDKPVTDALSLLSPIDGIQRIERVLISASMAKVKVTSSELLQLFELCIDAESRCLARFEHAQRNGDANAQAYEAQLLDKYRHMKHRLFGAMQESSAPSTIPFNQDPIRQLLRRDTDATASESPVAH